MYQDLIAMQEQYLAVENEKIKASGYEDHWLLTMDDLRSDEHVSALLIQWLEKNPIPKFTTHKDYDHAVEKAYWALRKDEACTFFLEGVYPLHVPSYRYNIEQAILGRADGTMLAASMAYVEKLMTNQVKLGGA